MNPNNQQVQAAAQHLIHLWQTDPRAALISLDVWPELGEAIDQLGETLAPPRARIKPGMALRIDNLQAGDVIRFDLPDTDMSAAYLNFEPWTVVDSHPDESRPDLGYWRISGHRPPGESFAQDEHGSFEVIWMGHQQP